MPHLAAAAVAALSVLSVLLAPRPALAAQGASLLDEAAATLRQDPVFVHPDAERGISGAEADDLRDQIRESGQPVFVAVLPERALDEVEGDASELPRSLAQRTTFDGTYAVVAGPSFRVGSSVLPSGAAGSAATAAFQAHQDEGTAAVLAAFVDRVARLEAGAGGGLGLDGSPEGTEGGDGGGSLAPLLLVGGAGALGIWALSRRRSRRVEEAEHDRETAQDRQLLQAELSVLSDDVLALEPKVALHPEAREDYDAAVGRYRAAAAAMEYADDAVDLVRVERVVREGQYAMARARARIDGREPPPPPAELRQPGRRDEPAIELDDERRPVYAGYGAPFYGGGGWFGGAGSFFGGLLLGGMMGGWGTGWGGGWGHDGGGDGGGWGDGGGGWSDGGGGDFGGGDFGGGDFDVGGGGGDWG